MTFSKSLICMYFIHCSWWLLVFWWTVRFGRWRTLLPVYLSVTKWHPDTYESVSGGNTGKCLSPTTSAELRLLRRCHWLWNFTWFPNDDRRWQLILIPGQTRARTFLTCPMASLRFRNICADSLENHSLWTLALEEPHCPDFPTKQMRLVST